MLGLNFLAACGVLVVFPASKCSSLYWLVLCSVCYKYYMLCFELLIIIVIISISSSPLTSPNIYMDETILSGVCLNLLLYCWCVDVLWSVVVVSYCYPYGQDIPPLFKYSLSYDNRTTKKKKTGNPTLTGRQRNNNDKKTASKR